MRAVDDALKNLTRRELEELRRRIDRELVVCMTCGNEGAEMVKARRGRVDAALPVCRPCFERYRLPEGRAETA